MVLNCSTKVYSPVRLSGRVSYQAVRYPWNVTRAGWVTRGDLRRLWMTSYEILYESRCVLGGEYILGYYISPDTAPAENVDDGDG